MKFLEWLGVKEQKPLPNNEDYIKVFNMIYRMLQREHPVPIGQNLTDYILKGFAFNPSVYTVVTMRATAAKGIPWLVYKVKNKKKLREYSGITNKAHNLDRSLKLKEESLEEVEGTPLNELMKRPNAYQSIQDFVEELWIFRDVVGNAYWQNIANPITGKVLQMHTLPGDRVQIIGGTPLEPVGGYILDYRSGEKLEPENVVHWKYPNVIWQPDGRSLYGMSPLKSAAMTISQDNMAIVGQSAAFQNEGLKGFITGTDQTDIEYTPEQAAELVEILAAKTGFKNNRKLAFHRSPLQFIKTGESPVDLGVMEARKLNREILCNIYRIHPSLLSTDASTLNNFKEARKALITTSVLPDLDSLKDHFNERVAKSFGPEYYIDYDLMAISEIQDDLHTLAQTLKVMDWVTINEKRAATQYDKYEDESADKLYQGMGLQELGGEFDTGFDSIDRNL
jgi:HK97 family phage portal protein